MRKFEFVVGVIAVILALLLMFTNLFERLPFDLAVWALLVVGALIAVKALISRKPAPIMPGV